MKETFDFSKIENQKKFENLPEKEREEVVDEGFAEKEKISAETISANALKNIIYKGESLPQDNRFLSFKEGGVFKYFEIDDLFNNKENKFYSLIKESQKIVGLSELEKNPYEENVMWIKFISIDPEYQEKGYASKLAEEIFRFAKENGISLETSSYSPEGHQKLKKIFKRLSEKYSVNFIDKEAVL